MPRDPGPTNARAASMALPAHIQPNKLERRGLAEGARTARLLAGESEVGRHIDARHDPATGLQFVVDTFGPSTVVAIHPFKTGSMARWLGAQSLRDVAAWVERLNAEGYNIYFTPNLPIEGLAKKPAKSDIRVLRIAAAADLDAKNGRSLDDALKVIRILPSPSLIIASGGGFQPLWMLDVPAPATPAAIAWAEALGSQIAKLVGGDAVQSVDHVFRLPFTTNHPNAKKMAAGRGVSLSGLVRGG